LLTTLSIHAPIQRHDLDDLISFIEVLRTGAHRLEELLT